MTYVHNIVWDFYYNGTDGSDGTIQVWSTPYAGKYKLEVWGASGNRNSRSNIRQSYGGYAVGVINTTASKNLYIVVGGMGGSVISPTGSFSIAKGGYNGGGKGKDYSDGRGSGGGGGATHISYNSGLLSTLSGAGNNLLIVAGGGGAIGGWLHPNQTIIDITAGSGGGYIGEAGISIRTGSTPIANGGTQSAPGSTTNGGHYYGKIGGFGYGADCETAPNGNCTGGGSGYYGGGSSEHFCGGGGGGSGYIGSSLLLSYGETTKHMTGYNLTNTTTVANIYTVSTTQTSSSAESDKAKDGHGHARITFIEP